MPTSPSPRSEQPGTPNLPAIRFTRGTYFRGFPIRAFATACQVARSPVRIRPIHSASGSFYSQASNGSVALPVAGYDYNSDWTPLLAGLSPTRMAASLAAPDPCEPDSGTRLPPWVIDGEALAGPGMEDMRFRKPLVDQLLYSFPREAVPLAAPPEHAKPEMGDVVT